MSLDRWIMGAIAFLSAVLLLAFIRRFQIRAALVAFLIAQLFSWPITLLFVQFGLQDNPVRLFPHATEGNFLFAFIFHPSVFTVYYLYYPKSARKLLRILYSVSIVFLPIILQYLVSLYTNLVQYPSILVPLGSYVMVFIVYNISRSYIDRFFAEI